MNLSSALTWIHSLCSWVFVVSPISCRPLRLTAPPSNATSAAWSSEPPLSSPPSPLGGNHVIISCLQSRRIIFLAPRWPRVPEGLFKAAFSLLWGRRVYTEHIISEPCPSGLSHAAVFPHIQTRRRQNNQLLLLLQLSERIHRKDHLNKNLHSV